MIQRETVTHLKSRLTKMKEKRAAWEPVWEDCWKYAYPARSNWTETNEEAKMPDGDLWNTKSITLLKQASDGLISNMAPRATPYFHITTRDPKLSKRYGVADWLEICEARVRSDLNFSRFYESISEFFPDALSDGTAYLYHGDNGLQTRFSCRHPMEMYIETDEYGEVIGIAREVTLSLLQAARAFGEKLFAVSKEYEDRIKDGKEYDHVTIAHFILPRQGVEKSPLALGTSKAYASYYVDMKYDAIISEGGYDDMPFHVLRYFSNQHETYGRSPTMDALKSIKIANLMAKSRIDLANRIVDPPVNVPENYADEIDLTPGGYNYMKGSEMVAPIEVGKNYPVAIEIINYIDNNIGAHFNSDFWNMLQQANAAKRNMTATEIMAMQGEKAQSLATAIGNIESMVLEPVIKREFSILTRRNMIPPVPDAIRDSDGLKIEYVGPLSQAQKKYHQQTGIFQALQLVAPIAQIDPNALFYLDTGELMVQAMDGAGMPASCMREKEDAEKMIQAKAQAEQAMQNQAMQLEQNKSLLGNVDKLNRPKVPGSMLDQMEKEKAEAVA